LTLINRRKLYSQILKFPNSQINLSTLLSKSTFIRSLQCLKSLYLYKKYYHLRDEISIEQQAIFDRGHKVGFLARDLFPGGIDAGWESPSEYRKSAELTQIHIEKGTPVIYEAAFVWNDVLVAGDILVKKETGWHLYEVKSSLKISDIYIRDAALQYYIIGKSGLDISGISIVHLDKNYVRSGDLNLNRLFRIEDVTEQARGLADHVIQGLIRARRTLLGDQVPEINIGPHCHEPYPCDFRNQCFKDIPGNSIFDLEDLEEMQKWELFGKNIINLKDIPEDYPLHPHQKIQVQSRLSGKVHIDEENIISFLSQLKSPVAILEILSARPAVPLNFGANPYKQIPFGYGKLLPVEDETVETQVYISEPGFDIEEAFIQNFINDFQSVESILVFDKTRELQTLKNSIERFPGYESSLNDILSRTIDLAEIFRNGHFYHPGLKQNWTLGDLPPAFGLENHLDNMRIKSDSQAGRAFEQLYSEELDLFRKDEIRVMIGEYISSNLLSLKSVYAGLKNLKLQLAS
jgi:hypothetical protein